jgi:hypothetical protein
LEAELKISVRENAKQEILALRQSTVAEFDSGVALSGRLILRSSQEKNI